jgi:hypothetical protein
MPRLAVSRALRAAQRDEVCDRLHQISPTIGGARRRGARLAIAAVVERLDPAPAGAMMDMAAFALGRRGGLRSGGIGRRGLRPRSSGTALPG